jgi:hypothetical protein
MLSDQRIPPEDRLVGAVTALRQGSMLVVGEGEQTQKDQIQNGKSEKQEVRAHTMHVRCVGWTRVLQ